jgi:hypothetical protein
VAGVIDVYFTWRTLKQTQEGTQATSTLTESGQFTERFTRAIDRLGATDEKGDKRLEIRLGGIYALERIAHDSPTYYEAVTEVLAAFIRDNARISERVEGRLLKRRNCGGPVHLKDTLRSGPLLYVYP